MSTAVACCGNTCIINIRNLEGIYKYTEYAVMDIQPEGLAGANNSSPSYELVHHASDWDEFLGMTQAQMNLKETISEGMKLIQRNQKRIQ